MNTLKNLFFLIFVSTIDSKPQLNNFLIGTSCVTRANEIGNCQYYENCPHLVEKLQNQQINQEDIFKCNSQGIICCTADVSTTTISTTTKSMISSDEDFESRAGIIRRIPSKISEEKCREYSKYTKSIITISGTLSNLKPTTMVNDKCQHKSTQLIVGGTSAHQHEFPHQAHLGYINLKNETKWACGGSLVSENYVLTAAHCRGSKSLDKVKFVKLGMIDRSQNDYNILYYKVIEIIEHPDYNPKSFENDIALLKLNRKVNFNQFIYPICLPTKRHDEPRAVATGLGRISGFEDQSNNLLKVELEKFSNEECQRIISTKTITENMLCYGSHTEKKDSCGGDSGGPLQILNDEEAYCTYKLIGVVSFGNANCGMAGFPEDITECSKRSIICCIPEIPAPHDHTFERISERKCKEYSEYTKSITVVAGTRTNPKPLSMVNDKCKHLSVQLVVGGKEAHEHEFPHQALLGYFRGSSHKWVCGGSLVSPKFVLTAAHCKFHKIEESGRTKVLNITNVKIGMTNLKNDEQTKIYRISRFIKHEEYNSFTKNSDIALVELTTNVQLSEKIHPICLPTKEYGPNTKALVTGFGRTENNSGMSDRLMKAVLDKFEHSRCEELYTNNFIDGAKMLCFGRNDSKKAVDSCNGDSGGPLQIFHESVNCSYIQIGIVSFGNQECTIKGFPGVYVNVFHFIDWIEKIVWPN